MDTTAALPGDLADLQDVTFAINATRKQDLVAQPASPAMLLNGTQWAHLRADSRARAWIPPHLLNSLR